MIVGLGVTVAVIIFLGSHAAVWMVRARAQARTAELFERFNDDVDNTSSDVLDVVARNRLARSLWLQELLLGFPITGRVAELLVEAGVAMTVAGFLALVSGAASLGALIGLALGMPGPLCAMLAAMAAALPALYLSVRRSRRLEKFESQLPGAMEFIILFMRAGRTLPQAFSAATLELPPPINEEFHSCAEEYRLGRPFEEALRALIRRFPASRGLRSFVTSIAVLNQVGGNLVEALETNRRNLLSEAKYALRLKAMTGETRMSATLIGALPGAFLLLSALVNTEYVKLFLAAGIGRFILGLSLFLWAAGIFWIRTLLRRKLD